MSGTALLHEARTMTFYAEPDRRTFDLDIKMTAAKEVKFGDTKEGSLGIRLNDKLAEQKGRGTGKMVNARVRWEKKRCGVKRRPGGLRR